MNENLKHHILIAEKTLEYMERKVEAMGVDTIQALTDAANNLVKTTEMLHECKLQLEYLNKKFPATGTTERLLSELETLLKELE